MTDVVAGDAGVVDSVAVDVGDVRRAVRAAGLLASFNAAGVLAPADVHVASLIGELCGESSQEVLLAAALAVRAPRIGHVCTDLATARTTTTVESDEPVDVQGLPWPADDAWTARVAESPAVAVGDDSAWSRDPRPLRLVGSLLYLDRYWREEQLVASEVLARRVKAVAGVDGDVLTDGLERLFEDPESSGGPDTGPDLQRVAAKLAVARRFTVVAGGPGTGKTTTVARILALVLEQAAAAGEPTPRIALTAPTGKAAARLSEAVHAEARELDVSEGVREALLKTSSATLHRLLGWMPGNRSRFRHHRRNRLAHDVVVVDEASMVSLSLMARLLDAVRPDARLVLVGDPDQLASVEAGAVLGDIVGPAGEAEGGSDAAGIVVLRRVYRTRKGSGLQAFARAVKDEDPDAAVEVLRENRPDLEWLEIDAASAPADRFASLRSAVVEAGDRVFATASGGDRRASLEALGEFRLLCAHRRGPYGVEHWRRQVEAWLATGVDGVSMDKPWYVGRPLLVTANDYALQLFNGDTGVVVNAGDGRVTAVFERRGEPADVSPALLSSVETVHAMTVHKSQGSQFASVALLLPEATSPILTRELLYTGATRASRRLVVIGEEASLRRAVQTPIARASGLRRALWG